MRYSFISPDYLTTEEAREWVFCIAYFLVAPPPTLTRPLTPDEVDFVEDEEDSDSDMITADIAKPDLVQAGVSSSEEEEDSEDETAMIEDDDRIFEDRSSLSPDPMPGTDKKL